MSSKSNVGCIVAAVLAFIVAAVLIFFGVLWILAASAPEASPGWLTQGIIMLGVGLALVVVGIVVLFVFKPKPPQEIIQKIDLTGDVEVAKLKCKNCGAELDKDSVSLKAGAVFVSCPFCGSDYQIVEEPKW